MTTPLIHSPRPTRVFVSYDTKTDAVGAFVHWLAARLRDDGIDVHAELFAHNPPDGWLMWHERQVQRADFVLVVCSEVYCRCFEDSAPAGGLVMKQEARLIRQRWVDDPRFGSQLLAVYPPGASTGDVPALLRGSPSYPMTDEAEAEAGYLALYRVLTDQPAIERPPLGRPRSLPTTPPPRFPTAPPRHRQVDKLTLLQFTSRLDRHTPWGELLRACNDHHHLVTWGIGNSQQSLDLFYERIKSRLSDHDLISFGHAFGAGASAGEWADWMKETVLRRRGGSLDEAIRTASQARPVMFLLDNQRGPLDEAALGPTYIDELVHFVEHDFTPAIARTRPAHAVRLFLAIQTHRRRSTLARSLKDAMQRVFEAVPVEIRHRELAPIKPPTLKEVIRSVDELLEPLASLGRADKAAVRTVHKEVSRTGTLRQLADRLYPLYERFYSERVGEQGDGR